MQSSTRNDIGENWTNRIFVFWIGGVAISPVRRECLETLSATQCQVHLVTDETLPSFVLSDAPLHPAYPLLSPIHRSDYLRAYFMHFYGGGYTDIKRTTKSWRAVFAAMNDADILGAGYRELPNGAGRFHRSSVSGKHYFLEREVSFLQAYLRYKLQRIRYRSLIGNCAFIFKPETEFTTRWLAIVHQRLDLLLPLLHENPARHPKEVPGRDYGDGPSRYPVPWSFLLGDILGPLGLDYRHRLLHLLPPPDFKNYE